MNNTCQTLQVYDQGDVLAVRRKVKETAARADFDANALAEVEIVAAELTTNLIKHAVGGGRVYLRVMDDAGAAGIEIRVTDSGPGITDLDRALAGGHSTTGTLGIGLSGAQRLVDDFAVQTGPGGPTEITVCKWQRKSVSAQLRFSVLATPFPGEQLSGDGYFIKRLPDYELFAVIDALGHGPEAHEVTVRCLETLEAHCREDPASIIDRCHKALRGGRGAAMALGRVSRTDRTFTHISVGNVDTRIYNTPQPVRPYCFNGTLGMTIEGGCRPLDYPLAPEAIIVMCSDGITSRFEVPTERFADAPAVIARSIFSQHVRGTDDATVLVARMN